MMRNRYPLHMSAALLLLLGGFVLASYAVPQEVVSEDDRNGFELDWTPDDFLEAGFGSATAAPLWKIYEWRPGLSRHEFEASLDALLDPPSQNVRAELLYLWEGHRERMLSLYSSGARTLWTNAEKMGSRESEERHSRALAEMSVAQAERFLQMQMSALDDVRLLFDEVARRLPEDHANDVRFVAAMEIDRLLREHALAGTHGSHGVGGVAVDVVKLARGMRSDAITHPVIRAALLQWFTDAEPLRISTLRASRRRNAVLFCVTSPDEEFVRAIRRQATVPALRTDLVTLRERLLLVLTELDALLSATPGSDLVHQLDAIAFPNAFPDRMRGEAVCDLLAAEPPEEMEGISDAGRETLSRICTEITALNVELRRIELEDQLLAESDGFIEARSRLQVWEARKAPLERRNVLNAELRETLRAELSPTAYRDLVNLVPGGSER